MQTTVGGLYLNGQKNGREIKRGFIFRLFFIYSFMWSLYESVYHGQRRFIQVFFRIGMLSGGHSCYRRNGGAKMKHFWKKTSHIAGTILVILAVFLALVLFGARLLGLRPFTVLSGSMGPEYPVGSLIYVRKAEPESIQAGDVITFVLNEELMAATHRVIAVDAENQCFYTKGDANEAADGAPVHFKNLIGRPIVVIPYLGYAVNFIQRPPGLYISIAITVSAVVLSFFPGGRAISSKKEGAAGDAAPDIRR